MWRQLKALVPNASVLNFVEQVVKPDLIHINDKAALNVGVSLKKSNIPIVQHSRSSYHSTACKLGKLLSAFTIKGYAHHIISISEDEEDGFEHFKAKSIIYNTVDFNQVKEAKLARDSTRTQLGILNGEYLIGFAAHVTEKKGAWDFLTICKTLKNHKSLKFILVGQLDEVGPTYIGNGSFSPLSPKEFVENFIQEHQLENQLMVTGFRKDNLHLIAAMDVLVVPNKNGVLGRQPIEAQALGTPVIAQKGHSNRSKIIKDNLTGYLVDNINASIDLIQQITNKMHRDELSLAASSHAAGAFNPVTNMQKIEQIYLTLIK
jgi:glycosyltransferase involved in cell wall biosynthesis